MHYRSAIPLSPSRLLGRNATSNTSTAYFSSLGRPGPSNFEYSRPLRLYRQSERSSQALLGLCQRLPRENVVVAANLNTNLARSSNIRYASSRSSNSDYSKNHEELHTPAKPSRSSQHPAGSRITGTSAAGFNNSPRTDPSSTIVSPAEGLPDLRQGIPSTFAANTQRDTTKAQRQRLSPLEVDTVDEPSPTGQGGSGGGGDFPKSAYETSNDRWRNRLANYSALAFLSLGLGGVLYLGREWDGEREDDWDAEILSGWAVGSIYARAKARLTKQMDVFTKPSFPKLLPKMDPAPPYTLVLSLEDLLIHSEWSRDHGWRMAKRPGVDYFLRYLSQYYELVVFTTLPFNTAEPILRKLDPYRIIMWPLTREATLYEKGRYIKELSYLNRDLSKVILIDTQHEHAERQPENAIILQPWKGDPKDRELIAFIPFLEHLAVMDPQDTRKVLESFAGKHIPTEFAEREARAREVFQQQVGAEAARRNKSSGLALLASGLGFKPMTAAPGAEPTLSQGLEKGKMLSDQIRERGLKNYEDLDKQIRENGDKWLKEMEVEEKKMQDESMKTMKTGFMSWFGAPKKD